MLVFTGAQMQKIDRYAIEVCGIDSKRLMENAAARIVSEMEMRLDLSKKNCVILCGRGNNGGDGFAAALLLRTRCSALTVVCLAAADALSEDAAYYRNAAVQCAIEIIRELPAAYTALDKADVILDALYGFGFHGNLYGEDAELARAVNQSEAFVFSADIPSGVSADAGEVEAVAVRADVTVTFTGYKLSALLFDSANYYGDIVVADIGIPKTAIQSGVAIAQTTDAYSAYVSLGERPRNAHKGDFGKVFILGGSTGMSGAVYMSTQAALKSGAGLVCAGVPEPLNTIMEIKTTEAMTLPLPVVQGGLGQAAADAVVQKANAYDATAFGMGAGRSEDITALLRVMLEQIQKPLVIDADGLNALARDMEILRGHKQSIVLTPHSGEMARLLGCDIADVEADRIACAKLLAQAYTVYVVFKGAFTVIAAPDGSVAMHRETGNSGMATGGSGDVLSGVLASMLARGGDVFKTVQAAVYVHGLAGDLAAAEKGMDGMTACDILEQIPYAILKLRQEGRKTNDR